MYQGALAMYDIMLGPREVIFFDIKERVLTYNLAGSVT
jgi:hypothetical protein